MVIDPLKPVSRSASIVLMVPLPPPTITTFSDPIPPVILIFGFLRLPLIASCSPVTYTEPFFSDSSNAGRASRAGAFSISPLVALKQAANEKLAYVFPTPRKAIHTPVPWASYTTIPSQNTLDHWSTIMCALMTYSCDLSTNTTQ